MLGLELIHDGRMATGMFVFYNKCASLSQLIDISWYHKPIDIRNSKM